jgi:hypothetical protein
LAEARNQLAKQAAQQLAGEAHQAEGLTDQAVPVDPGATGALQSAQQQAEQGAADTPQAPSEAGPAETGVGEAMQQAAADLGAREQQLGQAQAMAQQMASQPGSMEAAQAVAGQRQAANPALQQAMALAASLAPPTEQPGTASPMASGGGDSSPGQFAQNQKPPEMGIQDTPERERHPGAEPGRRNGDTQVSPQKFLDAPWMARLPPEMRKAIRAGSEGRPPRGYEERLRRYFRNIEE